MILFQRAVAPILLAAVTGAACQTAAAQGLLTRNEASLSRFAPLPTVGEGALPAAGRSHWALSLDLTNEFYADVVANESVLLDSETLNGTLRWRGGIADGWMVGVDLPLLHSGGGVLDSWIEDWHGWFGLPNGNREQFEQDRYRFSLVQDGAPRLARTRGTQGLGDVALRLGRALGARHHLHGLISAPTGSAERLTGGTWGAALWLESAARFGADGRWGGFYSAGATVQERRGPLADLQRPYSAFGSAGLDWSAWRALSLLGHLYGHTALYRDVATDIGDPGLQLALGARWRFSPQWAVDLAFQEDLIINASPDFSLHVGIRFHPE